MLVAIDLGVTQTKVFTGDKCLKFDSLVAAPPPHEIQSSDSLRGIEIVLNGHRHYVGEKAAHDGEVANYPVRPQALDEADDVRWCAALAAIGSNEALRITTGLPVYEYSAYKEALAKHMTKEWSFIFNGQPMQVPVEAVDVMPQGAGAYYAAILSPDGKVLDPRRVHSKILVLDLGGRTLNAVTFLDGRFKANGSFTLFKGMVSVYNRLRKLLLKEHGVPLTVYAAGQAFRAGSLLVNGSRVDLRYLIQQAMSPVWSEIQDGLELEIPDWRTYHEVLLAGASELFVKQIQEFFRGVPVTLLENAEFANVRGYGAYGVLQQSRRAPIQP